MFDLQRKVNATPAQLKQLKEAIQVAEPLQQLARSNFYEGTSSAVLNKTTERN
jgi:hypothetical protein